MNHNAKISVSQQDDIDELNQQSDLDNRATRPKSIFVVVEQQFVRYIFIFIHKKTVVRSHYIYLYMLCMSIYVEYIH